MTFAAATPPDHNGNGNCACRTRSRVRAGDHSDTQASCFGMIEISVCMKTLERSIGSTSNRLVSMKIGEQQLETNTGTWPDKMEHFLTKFKDIAPAAKLQANMATESMDNIGSDAFAFADMETLDANLVVTPRGNPNADFTLKAQDRARCLCFTITVSPQLIVPGAINFDPSTFSNPTLTTACVRALVQNGGLAQGIMKHLLNNTPKLSLFFCQQAHYTKFDASIKH